MGPPNLRRDVLGERCRARCQPSRRRLSQGAVMLWVGLATRPSSRSPSTAPPVIRRPPRWRPAMPVPPTAPTRPLDTEPVPLVRLAHLVGDALLDRDRPGRVLDRREPGSTSCCWWASRHGVVLPRRSTVWAEPRWTPTTRSAASSASPRHATGRHSPSPRPPTSSAREEASGPASSSTPDPDRGGPSLASTGRRVRLRIVQGWPGAPRRPLGPDVRHRHAGARNRHRSSLDRAVARSTPRPRVSSARARRSRPQRWRCTRWSSWPRASWRPSTTCGLASAR